MRVSFDQPEYTADVVATGTLRLLEAVRDYMAVSGEQVRVYQAGVERNVRDGASSAERTARAFIRVAPTR